jgi:hypothetical protein
MMTYLGYVEDGSGREGWITSSYISGHLAIEWDHRGRRTVEIVTPDELMKRMPHAFSLHRRIKTAAAGVDPSGC